MSATPPQALKRSKPTPPQPQPPQGGGKAAVRRIPFRLIVVLLLGAVYLLATIAGMIGHGRGFASAVAYAEVAQHMGGFVLNLWGLVFGLVVGVAVLNPFAWLNGKRLVIGCTAFALNVGYLGLTVTSQFVFMLVNLFQPQGFGQMDVQASAALWALLGTFLLMPFLMLSVGSSLILSAFTFVAAAFAFVIGVPVLIFNQIFHFELALIRARYEQRGLAGYLGRFFLWLHDEPLPKAAPDDSKGARFAADEEIAALHKPNSAESMGFGHIGNPVFLKTDKHVLIMASTRSGKGVTLIIPHLLRYQGSAFVLDPKGENAKATGRRRATLNDKVHYLDPFGISGKPQARFNPLTRFTPDNMEAESKALAAALFVLGEEKRDHWTAAGQQLLASIILYVYCAPEIPKEHKDLPTVRRILLGAVNDTLNAMLELDDADGLLRDLAISFKETPEKEFGSIVSTAQRQTEILDNPAIIACLSASGHGEEVDFAQWHRGTMTVYLCLSAPKFPVFNRWLRLVLTSALDEMTDSLDPPKLPVCFMLDELATLGHVAPIENAVGLAAGYGVQLVTVFQDVAQMRDLYKGRWASFIGNAGVRALFNLDDYDTAKYWSDFLGGRRVESRSHQEDKYGLSKGENVGETMRPLLSPDEIMLQFGADRMLVLPQGQHPFATKRVPYWNDARLNGLWDDPRVPVPRVARPAPPPRPAAPPSNPPPSAPDDRPPPTPPRPVAPSPVAPAARPFAAKPVLDIKRMRAKPETPAPAPAARSETPAAPPRAAASVPKLPPFEQVFPDLKPSGKEAPGATPEPDPLESLEDEFARLVGRRDEGQERE